MTVNLSDADERAVNAPRAVNTSGSLQVLVDYLCGPFTKAENEVRFSDANQLKIVRVLFRWAAQHIEYDMNQPGNTVSRKARFDQSPEAVLLSRKALCAGFAGLLKALLDEAGCIESVIIHGFSKGATYTLGTPASQMHSNHAWNAVKVRSQTPP